MKACASCSGGVMFVPDAIERVTNKQSKAQSYKDIVAGEVADKPMREKIFGVFIKRKSNAKAA